MSLDLKLYTVDKLERSVLVFMMIFHVSELQTLNHITAEVKKRAIRMVGIVLWAPR